MAERMDPDLVEELRLREGLARKEWLRALFADSQGNTPIIPLREPTREELILLRDALQDIWKDVEAKHDARLERQRRAPS